VLAADQQRAAGTFLVGWPLPAGHEGPVGEAHGREVENGAEVECESGAERVIASCGVDEEHVWPARQGPCRGF
jgi:hypothetical protein